MRAFQGLRACALSVRADILPTSMSPALCMKPSVWDGARTALIGWLAVLFACTPLICLKICELRHRMPVQPSRPSHSGHWCDFISAKPSQAHAHVHEHAEPFSPTLPARDENPAHSQSPLEAQRMVLGIVEFVIATIVLHFTRRLLQLRLPPAPAPLSCAPAPPRLPPRFCRPLTG